jgi:inosine-uridine nucleoside N-ribohydrolase
MWGVLMRSFFFVCLSALVFTSFNQVGAQGEEGIKIIFDTDFVMPPYDDSMALMLALQSPEIEILGVTTVAGNESVERATSDALRMLEIANRNAIPVYQGADMPLVHEKSDFAEREWGNWYSDEPPLEPPGGYASNKVEDESAVSFIVNTVIANPKEVTLVAIGPLTNIAQAIRADADFAKNVKSLVIMGGAIALLPDGAGNMTPNAEFNFWVDPEAAYITLRSGIPIELSPLNVSRKSLLTKHWYEKMVTTDTPLTRLLKDTLGKRFEENADLSMHMYDQIAMASVIDPTLVSKEPLYVDVNIEHGISYGVSVGGRKIWPGAEGAQRIDVQYDLDWPRFIDFYVNRVSSPLLNSVR